MVPRLKTAPAGLTDARLAVFLGLFALAIHWCFRAESFGPFQDSAHYLAGAKALAGGHGYTMSDFVGAPKIAVYAPGWPAILSLVWRLAPEFPSHMPAIQALMALIMAGTSVAGFLWMRRLDVPAAPAWLAAAIWTTTLRTHEYGVWLMSDPALSLLTFVFALCWMSSPDRSSARWWLLAGGFSLAALLLRTASLGLALGIGLAGLVGAWRERGNRPRMLAMLASTSVPALCFLVAWKLWSRGGYGSAEVVAGLYPPGKFLGWYAGEKYKDLVNLVVGRLWGELFCSVFGRIPAVAARHGEPAFWATRILVVVLNAVFTFWIARGFWSLRVHEWAGPLFLVAGTYSAFVVLAPMPEAYLNRYLMPVWPLIAAAVWEGRPSLRGLRPVSFAVLVSALAANVAWLPRARTHWNEVFAMDELKATALWIRDSTPPGTPVAVDYALPFVHLAAWSGRPLVSDYYHPRWAWSYVGYLQQGCPAAEYVVTSDQGYQRSEPPAGSTEMFRSRGGHFIVSRPDPVLDAARRAAICPGQGPGR